MISRIGAGNYIGKYALSCTQDIPVFFQCDTYNIFPTTDSNINFPNSKYTFVKKLKW